MRAERRSFAIMVIALIAAACASSAAPSAMPPSPNSPAESAVPSTAPTPSFHANASDGPAPTVFIPASESFTAGLMYICGIAAFPIELLEAPGTAHLRGDPAAAFLLSEFMTADEWWMVDRTATRAEFVGLRSDGQYENAIADRDADGKWVTNNFGSCHPYSALQGLGAVDRVTWWIRKADWPQPSDTKLRIRARDFCPQTLGDRLSEPTIRYGDDKFLMILSAEETDSYCGDGTNQVTSLTIDLTQPVGDRSLWDGSNWPGRDAHVPSEPRGLSGG